MEQVHGGDVYRHPGALDFSSNMNPMGTPPRVIEAAQRAVLRIAEYPDVFQEKLIGALADYERVGADHIICGNGAAELIFALAYALAPARTLLCAPSFAEYEQAVRAAGSGVDFFYLKEERSFRLTEEILPSVTEDTDLLILCNPNNPTGELIDPDLLIRIADRCRETGTFLMVDECFQDFVDEEEQFSLREVLSEYPDLFLLKAFTKRYAMAGIRLGYGLASSPDLIERMRRTIQPWNVSLPAQEAGLAALEEEEYLEISRRLIRTERSWLKKELAGLGLELFGSHANYIFFKGPAGLVDKALARGVLIRDCSNYPGLMEGCYRVAVRTHEENRRLIEALA